MDRAAAMLLVALHDALAETRWQTLGNDVAVVIGTTSGGMTLGQEFYRQAIQPPLTAQTGPKNSSLPIPTTTARHG
jgi:3-oxoacyl-(acyl-carrier-protein) synthase